MHPKNTTLQVPGELHKFRISSSKARQNSFRLSNKKIALCLFSDIHGEIPRASKNTTYIKNVDKKEHLAESLFATYIQR